MFLINILRLVVRNKELSKPLDMTMQMPFLQLTNSFVLCKDITKNGNIVKLSRNILAKLTIFSHVSAYEVKC